jgi:hypothetical protein
LGGSKRHISWHRPRHGGAVGGTVNPSSRRAIARTVAAACEDAYSFDRYRSWPAVSEAFLKAGLDPLQAEAMMRSKHTRWAADASNRAYGRATSTDITKYITKYITNLDVVARHICKETFGVTHQEDPAMSNERKALMWWRNFCLGRRLDMATTERGEFLIRSNPDHWVQRPMPEVLNQVWMP